MFWKRNCIELPAFWEEIIGNSYFMLLLRIWWMCGSWRENHIRTLPPLLISSHFISRILIYLSIYVIFIRVCCPPLMLVNLFFLLPLLSFSFIIPPFYRVERKISSSKKSGLSRSSLPLHSWLDKSYSTSTRLTQIFGNFAVNREW